MLGRLGTTEPQQAAGPGHLGPPWLQVPWAPGLMRLGPPDLAFVPRPVRRVSSNLIFFCGCRKAVEEWAWACSPSRTSASSSLLQSEENQPWATGEDSPGKPYTNFPASTASHSPIGAPAGWRRCIEFLPKRFQALSRCDSSGFDFVSLLALATAQENTRFQAREFILAHLSSCNLTLFQLRAETGAALARSIVLRS